MPGWHKATQGLVESGQLVLLGVTQEQHAERCRLFAQWHEFTWPILHDPINLLESAAVPIVVAIDEHGIVRSTRPSQDWLKETFVSTNFEDNSSASKQAAPNPKPGPFDATRLIKKLKAKSKLEPTAGSYRRLGDAYALWKPDTPTLAINAYQAALANDADDPRHHFRLGVALRHRYDSSQRERGDFQSAAEHWTSALDLNPNQYIWRRRIQQYGPRLTKPYPFYDWVPNAKQEIAARGETPIPLRVPLSGAEVAKPKRVFEVDSSPQHSPDPDGKITLDVEGYVQINAVSVPTSIHAGETARVHLEFTLASKQAHWNNESEPLRVWIDTPTDWKATQPLLIHRPKVDSAESTETRRLEVEVQSPKQAKSSRLTGYALYYVCDDRTGACLYRRQDFSVSVRVKSK